MEFEDGEEVNEVEYDDLMQVAEDEGKVWDY